MTRFHGNNKALVQPNGTAAKARNKASNFKENVEGSESPIIGVFESGVLVEQGNNVCYFKYLYIVTDILQFWMFRIRNRVHLQFNFMVQ